MQELITVFRDNTLEQLEQLGYLRTVNSKIVFTEMFLNIITNCSNSIENTAKSSNLEALCSQLIDIFPDGKNSAGQRWRSTQSTILERLGKFKKKYKFSNEEIINATKAYVNFFKSKNYEYMRTLKYFIEKQGVGSDLAEWCENPEVIQKSFRKQL